MRDQALLVVCLIFAGCDGSSAFGNDSDGGDAGGGAGDGSVSSDAAHDAVSVRDGAVGDGNVGDGSAIDGAVVDGAVADGSVPDGSVPDGSLPDGSVEMPPDGAVPDGSVEMPPDASDDAMVMIPDGSVELDAMVMPDGDMMDAGCVDIDHDTVCDDEDNCLFGLACENDEDNDGWPDDFDCGPSDPEIYPGAPDIIGDGVDSNCDWADKCYVDWDGDGARSELIAVDYSYSCEANQLAFLDAELDCDDLDYQAYPHSDYVDVDGDGIDTNCDGTELCYVDADGDGFRSNTTIVASGEDVGCEFPLAKVTTPVDCDDDDSAVLGGQAENPGNGVDEDCDGRELCYVDADKNGHGDFVGTRALSPPGKLTCSTSDGLSPVAWTCTDPFVVFDPGAEEVVGDEIDSNCDGIELCYVDADQDGAAEYTEVAGPSEAGCKTVDSRAPASAPYDCDDSNPAIPSETDAPANGVDEDCDGFELCYRDFDLDGFRSEELLRLPLVLCYDDGTDAPPSSLPADCFDYNPYVYPGSEYYAAVERGDGSFDANCDGEETEISDSSFLGHCVLDNGHCDFEYGWAERVSGCGTPVMGLADCIAVTAAGGEVTSCEPFLVPTNWACL